LLLEIHSKEGEFSAMKQISRREFLRGSVLAAAATALAACTSNAATTIAPTTIPATDTVAPVVPTATTAAATAAATTAATAAATTAPTSAAPTLDRNKTMYFNGQQWNAVTGWNPYSSNMNNAMAISQADNARVLMFETPYLYDMLDAKQYPLLADGAWAWNSDKTAITFKIKKAALWSDGTAVTADDVAYTWASNVKYNSSVGTNYSAYIDSVTATDTQTVTVKPNWMPAAKSSILCKWSPSSVVSMFSKKRGRRPLRSV
jgi:peptide/nickel transport system substrate-binding protein